MPKKPKPRVLTFRLVNEVYQYALFIRVGGTRDEANRWFAKKFDVPEFAGKEDSCRPAATTIYHTAERSHLIWFSTEPGAGLIAHEALHSVLHVLTHSGLGPLSEATEEAYAYLIQWTVREICSRAWAA